MKLGKTDLGTRFKEALPRGLRKTLKVHRALAFERLGSHRYSRPALHGLDEMMLQRLPRQGVFLEVGANDGYSQSNTYYLEQVLGWRGILIEPLPDLFLRCRRLRRGSVCFNVACTAEAGGFIEIAELDLMSVALGQQSKEEERERVRGAQRRVVVPATTISRVIDESGFTAVDFMSIDVEGAELSLLAGLDWSRHTPQWLLIETAHLERVIAATSPWMTYEGALSVHDHLFRRVSTSPR